jgi:hypothetical protein
MFFRVLYILVSILIVLPAFAADNRREESARKSAGALFLPYSELTLSGKYYTPYRNDYHSALDMFLLAELFRLGNFDLSFDFTGTTTFRENSGGIEPDLIFYRINYLTARWKTPIGHAGLFFDHLCNNRININDREEDKIRWYGAGFRWEAPGFSGSERLKHAGSNPYLTGSISAAYGWHTEFFPYKMLLSGTIRAEGPDIFILSPYLEGTVTGKIGDEKNLDLKSEAGIKAGWGDGEFILFTGTERVRGTNGYYADEGLNHFTGIRFSSWIDDTGAGRVVEDRHEEPFRFPKIFFNGAYGKYIRESPLNFHADIHMLLYFPAAESIGLYGSTRLKHDSLKESNGMYPRYIQYSFESGLNISPGFLRMTFIPYVHFHRYDEGNIYDGYSNWFTSVGMRIATAPYNGDSRMMQNGSLGTESWFPLIWASCERVSRNGSFPVDWIVQLNINQWLLREEVIGISLSGIYFKYFGDLNTSEYSLEPALNFGRKRFFAIFYRYTYHEKEMLENGIFSTEHLIGARLTF